MRVALSFAFALALAGCQTANGADWTFSGTGTPYRQAERSCLDLTQSIEEEAKRRDFFIGCMKALGWTPNPGATIDL